MQVKDLEEVVDNMILQHDYPGCEPRALKIALPQAISQAPAKLYLAALDSNNVFVKLVSLRWFQTRPGAARSHAGSIVAQLENADPWIRLEAIKTIAIAKTWEDSSILKVSSLLKDTDEHVRAEAAKVCGGMFQSLKKKKLNDKAISLLEDKIIAALQEASNDTAQSVRRKAIKSLRKLGAFS